MKHITLFFVASFFCLFLFSQENKTYKNLIDALREPTKVYKLDISGKGLPSTSLKNIEKLVNLKHLNLSGNRITEIPPVFGQLKNLETLNLSKNQIYEKNCILIVININYFTLFRINEL